MHDIFVHVIRIIYYKGFELIVIFKINHPLGEVYLGPVVISMSLELIDVAGSGGVIILSHIWDRTLEVSLFTTIEKVCVSYVTH